MHRLILTAVGLAGVISHANSLLLIAGLAGGTRGPTGFVCAEQGLLSLSACVITTAFVHYAAAFDYSMAGDSGEKLLPGIFTVLLNLTSCTYLLLGIICQ